MRGCVSYEEFMIGFWVLASLVQFPANTYDHPSEASPKIDSERMLFKRQVSKLSAAASKMIGDARRGDLNAFTSSFRNIGKSCSSCHKGFRLKRQR